ncbi:putative ferric-chelate reductase 1 [Lampris incognitus]|uniref:putative ferric-chelate reductase 1 n=1 Tax=Lampris incognitus TaxID=2546036 RepID=UPI0024B5E4B1|nr:putative ferric-chelate reductase 1 [Lampris incognitus]
MERVLLLLGVLPVAGCYSSGLVAASCGDLRPRHSGSSTQLSRAPFTVSPDRQVYGDQQEITVRLEAAGGTPFIGFMLQAREVGGGIPPGSFRPAGEEARLLSCAGAPSSAVSHTSESPKTSIQVIWTTAASGNPKTIEFHASFVQDYGTFWVKLRSPPLMYSNESAGMDDRTSVTPETSAPPPAAQMVAGGRCGVSKVCFSQPLNCDPTVSTDCYFMSARRTSATATALQFEMAGPSQGYVSFGFSDDQIMGNDDIYICGLDSQGIVQLQRAFSVGRQTPKTLPLGNVSDVRASVRDGIISCSFTSKNPISTHRTADFSKPYYLMFAHGPSGNGQILFHTGTFISDEKVDLLRPRPLGIARPPQILKAHGALMLIAWMTMGTLGMVIARYMKGLAKGRSYWGKDLWFLLHVALMSLTVAATITAFILSFSHVRVWSGGAHPVLGCLVMILSFLQPVAALFRCGPHLHLRFIFTWSHTVNAVAVKSLAVAAIFTGLSLIDSTEDRWLLKVMGGLVGWEVVFYICFDLHLRWRHRDTDDAKAITLGFDLIPLAVFFLGDLTFLAALLVGIGMS